MWVKIDGVEGWLRLFTANPPEFWVFDTYVQSGSRWKVWDVIQTETGTHWEQKMFAILPDGQNPPP